MRSRNFHFAVSVDVDRFTDDYLRSVILPSFTDAQVRSLSPSEFRAACAKARAAGLSVFPPCDKTNPDGSCAGHEFDPLIDAALLGEEHVVRIAEIAHEHGMDGMEAQATGLLAEIAALKKGDSRGG